MNIAIVIFGGICLVLGFVFGCVTTRLDNTDGLFIVNDNDPETTRWILDVKIDPKTIPNKKAIRLKVRKISEE